MSTMCSHAKELEWVGSASSKVDIWMLNKPNHLWSNGFVCIQAVNCSLRLLHLSGRAQLKQTGLSCQRLC